MLCPLNYTLITRNERWAFCVLSFVLIEIAKGELMVCFDNIRDNAPEGQRAAVKALQVWIILISKAVNRQTINYNELSKKIGYENALFPLNQILGHIMYFCIQNNIPPLTIIVVSQEGIPGEGLVTVELNDISKFLQKQENVFKFDWFNYLPPTIDEFHNAWEIGNR